MKKQKLTPWFDTNIPPLEKGEYDYKYPNGYKFKAFWDGEEFMIHDSKEPEWWGKHVAEDGQWRGLAKEPK